MVVHFGSSLRIRRESLLALGTLLVALIALARPLEASRPDVAWLAGGHKDDVTCVAYSPDGHLLATGSYDESVKLWRVPDRVLFRNLTRGWSRVRALVFSPDGLMFAAGAEDGNIKLWRTSDWALLATVAAHTGRVRSLAFTSDSQVLVSGSDDTTVKLWRASDVSLVTTLTGHTVKVNAVAVSPDGQMLATAGDDIQIWHLPEASFVRKLAEYTEPVLALAFSPDSQTLASGGYDRMVRLWRVADGSPLHTLTGHTSTTGALAFSPDGTLLASGGWDNLIKLWNVADGSSAGDLVKHTRAVTAVQFAPDGQRLVSASPDRLVCFWDVPARSLINYLLGPWNSPNDVQFSPDGQLLASGGWDYLWLFDAKDGRYFGSLNERAGAMAWSPDGSMIAVGTYAGQLVLYRSSDRKLIRYLNGSTVQQTSLAFSPDGKKIVSTGRERVVRVWNVEDGSQKFGLQMGNYPAAACFTPDGQYIVSFGGSGGIQLWRVSDGQLSHTLPIPPVNVAAFVGDGSTIAVDRRVQDPLSGVWRPAVQCWDVKAGLPLWTHVTEMATIGAIAASPDGRTIACSAYRTYPSTVSIVELLRASDGRLLASFDEETGSSVSSLAFSPDGSLLSWCGVESMLATVRNPVPGPLYTPGEGKLATDSTRVVLTELVVTAVFPDFFYVQDETRCSGIRVAGAFPDVQVGSKAKVEGVVVTNADGERYVQPSSVAVAGAGFARPLALSARSLGGQDLGIPPLGQQGVLGGIGANNIGLLVTTSGAITAIDPSNEPAWFTLWDGSGYTLREDGGERFEVPADPSGNRGVRVDASGLPLPGLVVGDGVTVTGISSCYRSGSDIYPRILARTAEDVSKQ